MGTVIVEVVLCIIIPFLLLGGILERRRRYLAIAVCAGCLACLAAYYLNTWFYRLLGCSYFYLSTTAAPLIEECAKFIPIFLFAHFAGRQQRPLLCFAFAVGLGFSIVENMFMLAQSVSDATIPWILVRGIGTGLMHGMSTSITGIGIHLAAKDRRMAPVSTAATLFLAMMYHGAYNAMIMTDGIKYFGIFIPLLSYAAVLAFMNREQIRKFLEE